MPNCQDNKDMVKVFKKICITPIDEDVRLMAESAKIINEFKRRGFITRSSFVGLVTDNISEYLTIKNMNKLNTYWAGRVRDGEMNTKLLDLLKQLENE